MATWILTCPQCKAANEVLADKVEVECGLVSCTCICTNCGHKFSDEQPYWRWLELNEEPPSQPESAANNS